MPYEFIKGHGTENDFVLLPDLDGTVHGELALERVRALCDRRAGIGGDGVLRVIRTASYDALDCSEGSRGQDAEWFMDYRNSDGSVSEMCGNGIRVLVRHLVDEGLVDGSAPVPIGTRDGVKTLTVDGDLITADMGSPKVLGETEVRVGDRILQGLHVDMGNPHAVVAVADLAEAGPLLEPPGHDPAVYPDGVNVEFVRDLPGSDPHIAMRVHERGSGETRSCGTGACAAAVASGVWHHARREGDEVTYRVDVPGGTLLVTWTADDRVLLTGPAVLVARGTTSL
jgi:diaminopimelate epimerase